MGIETATQLHVHPLYGAIFETAVVSELRKRDLNTGNLPRLYYWRDNQKLEIDLIKDDVDGPRLIEIKSGRTYHDEWSKPIRRWLATTGVSPDRAKVVYGGTLAQKAKGIEVVPWYEV